MQINNLIHLAKNKAVLAINQEDHYVEEYIIELQLQILKRNI